MLYSNKCESDTQITDYIIREFEEMKREDIIRKIEGLLAVSKGQANESESQTALLLARKLMAKHDIDLRDVEGGIKRGDDGIVDFKINEPKMVKWYEVQLAMLVAQNFKVKVWRRITDRKTVLSFYGYEEDCDFAREIFFMALDAMTYHAKEFMEYYYITDGRYIKKTAKHTNMIKDSYLNGFLSGLSQAFENQNKEIEEEFGLMIVTPAIVEQKFKERDFKRSSVKAKRTADSNAYFEGLNDGKSTSVQNKARIEGGE